MRKVVSREPFLVVVRLQRENSAQMDGAQANERTYGEHELAVQNDFHNTFHNNNPLDDSFRFKKDNEMQQKEKKIIQRLVHVILYE